MKLIYWRYSNECEEDHETIESAVRSAKIMHDNGLGCFESIISDDGRVLMREPEILNLICELPESD